MRAYREPLVSMVAEEVYTDREEHIDHLFRHALRAIDFKSWSIVLLGTRRMGKTEIFKRTVNRLFWEQDHRDPRAVVPVFYTFPDRSLTEAEFGLEYLMNYLRWNLAFRERDARFLEEGSVMKELLDAIRKNELTRELERPFNLAARMLEGDLNDPAKEAIYAPFNFTNRQESGAVIFLDEFQNVKMPYRNFDVAGLYQEVAESPRCPHFVTGSAMSILSGEIIGRGPLFGRFKAAPIKTLTDYHGTQLAIRAAKHHGANLPDVMAPVVAAHCGNNPYYVTAVVQQSVEQGKAITDESVLNELLAFDISGGFIWSELNDQVNKWMQRVNEFGITKWVLYLSALEEGDEINIDRIREELWKRDRREASFEQIRDTLVKLARGDLVHYGEIGPWFRKMDDPILLEFLKVWGRVNVEQFAQESVSNELIKEFVKKKNRFSEYEGYLAEVFMSQALWNGQRKTLPGRLFHHDEDIVMPHTFHFIRQRSRRYGPEFDLEAAAGVELWLCESKYWKDRRVGTESVLDFLRNIEVARRTEGDSIQTWRFWFFSNTGFTYDAEKFMTSKNIFWSERADLDELLELLDLRKLPEL